MTPSPEDLRELLSGASIRDQDRLGRRLRRARGQGDLAALAGEIGAAAARVAARAGAVPSVSYPAELPVSARRDELLAAIRDHQVVVVAGETGSGKTTQLPKMCLELGRGVRGMIGHTQPRRIAARTVAERIADELGVPLGGPVGYAVRFDDKVGDSTLVKVMTDGILLAELKRDRRLLAYDTVIVDEAHERSLNIDFLLGTLTKLLPERPDLKVVITSATIDTARFAAHFDAPVVEVSGRTWPVEIRYRPLDDDSGGEGGDPGGEAAGPRDQPQAICDAVEELSADGPGDILVFLAGERDIRDAADALRSSVPEGTEILPLYARLSAAEQHRVFRPHRGRRVVLATNVAETSLTVPGVRYVIDTGTARISRYSTRSKVQRLPIEAVSRASADQRAGRCGRVGPGVCVRLYSEEDYQARPEFTDPEILRTSLASVILQMAAIGLGDIESFPFVDPPDRRAVTDGVALLEELGAFRDGDRGRLSALGRRLAELPLDPRIGRMVIEAERRDCLREVTVIAAALSIQDPRERPSDQAQAADESHRRFAATDSDFLTYVRLWDHLAEAQEGKSRNQFRRQCRAEFLNVVRVREWQDLAGQIRSVWRAAGAHANREPAHPDQVHQAVLSGLLSHVGMRDAARGDYRGARGTRFSIGRGSVLARRSPAWVMAAELVETGRTWARTAARIEPAWAERLGAHVARTSLSEPWWDPQRGEAMADERVTLYGLPVVARRPVPYRRTDPADARDMFLRHGLVEGDWAGVPPFVERTRRRMASVRRLEDRVRRRDLLAGDDARHRFYDERVPATVDGGPAFLRWWRKASAADPELLDVPFSVLVDPAAGPLRLRDWPEEWVQGDVHLPLRYRFAPGEDDDGVTAEVPLGALNRLGDHGFDWNVPGLRAELVGALVRSLPKALRRRLVPAADVAAEVAAACGPADGPLLEVVARELARRAGEPVPASAWSALSLPAHLRVRFEVVGPDGRVVAAGRDLRALRRALSREIRAAVAAAAPGLERHGARGWEFGDLPRRVSAGGVVGYPALLDEGDAVGVAVLDSPEAQADATWVGTRRLLVLGAPLPAAHVQRRLTNDTKLALARWREPLAAVLEDCAAAAADEIIAAAGGPAFDAAGFEAMAAKARSVLADRVIALATLAGGVLAAADRVEEAAGRLEKRDAAGVLGPSLADVRRQVDGLVPPGFVSLSGAARLADTLRYLQAAHRRLERLPGDLHRDSARMAVVARVQHRYEALLDQVVAGVATPEVRRGLPALRWSIEELRVSLYAQALGTAGPVSEERIMRAMDAMTAGD